MKMSGLPPAVKLCLLVFVFAVFGGTALAAVGADKRFFITPVFSYSPETGPMGGITALLGLPLGGRHAGDALRFQTNVLYSSNEHALAELTFDIPADTRGLRIVGGFGYRRSPFDFYGVGNDAAGPPQGVINESAFLDILARAALTRKLVAGFGFRFTSADINPRGQGSFTGEGLVGGEGGDTAGIGYTVSWDSRDSPFFPRRGAYLQTLAFIHDRTLGSDFDFTRMVVDARAFIPLFESHTVGFQLYGAFSGGTPPFYELPALGGQHRMRGFYEGRYRDRQYLTLQAEYRLPLLWKFGVSLFAGVGDVAGSLGGFRLAELKYSYGAGLRFLVNREKRIPLRLDYAAGRSAFGQDGTGVYLTLYEAF